jgi:hypothetical protein
MVPFKLSAITEHHTTHLPTTQNKPLYKALFAGKSRVALSRHVKR